MDLIVILPMIIVILIVIMVCIPFYPEIFDLIKKIKSGS